MPNNLSDLGLFLSTGIIAPSAFSESFEHKLGLKRKEDMAKIFARTQSAKTGLTGIYFRTKLTFSEISKQKTGNRLMYYILYFTIHI